MDDSDTMTETDISLTLPSEYSVSPGTDILYPLRQADIFYSKKIFKFDGYFPVNIICYISSLIFMEETIVITLLSAHLAFGSIWKVTLQYYFMFFINVLMTIATKFYFGRIRPCSKELDGTSKSLFFRMKQNRNKSFPSGDTIQAYVLVNFCILNFEYQYFLAVSPLMILVPFSRVYLGCHFIGDTIAGALLATGLTVLCYLFCLIPFMVEFFEWAGEKF